MLSAIAVTRRRQRGVYGKIILFDSCLIYRLFLYNAAALEFPGLSSLLNIFTANHVKCPRDQNKSGAASLSNIEKLFM